MNNQINMQRLALGMTKDQVMETMRSLPAETHDGAVLNPWRNEVSVKGSDTYETLYYVTKAHPPFTPIRDAQTTPVVLKNGKVIGWGQQALSDSKQ